MAIRREVPPIRIPIEITIEDEQFAKVQQTIGKRKETREEIENAKFVREKRREEKLDKRREKQADRLIKKEIKESDKIEKKEEKRKDQVKKKRESNVMFGARQIGNIGHPLGIIKSLASRLLPILIPIIVIETAKKISAALTQKGSIFDLTFRNIVDDRINVLRSRESQQEIRVGFEGKSQLILTTRAGTTSPISSYNSYEQRNNNELNHLKMRAVRSTGL